MLICDVGSKILINFTTTNLYPMSYVHNTAMIIIDCLNSFEQKASLKLSSYLFVYVIQR